MQKPLQLFTGEGVTGKQIAVAFQEFTVYALLTATTKRHQKNATKKKPARVERQEKLDPDRPSGEGRK